MNWAWGIDLPPPTKIVLLKLADRANDDGVCWPGQASMAHDCGMSERSVMRHLADLEKRGLILIEHRKGENGRQSTNLYHLVFSHVPGDKLAPGDDAQPGDNGGQNRVTSVSPYIKEEPSIEPSGHPALIVQRPITLQTDGSWLIDDAVFDHWLAFYQRGRTLDLTETWIEGELFKASMWLRKQPKRKQKKDLFRFLCNWLDRAINPQPFRQPSSKGAPHDRVH